MSRSGAVSLWADGNIIDLTLDSSTSSYAVDINASGEVLLVVETADGQSRAYQRAVDGELMPIGTLEGGTTIPYDLNDNGQVVGISLIGTGQWHAFSWTQSGGIIDLGTLGGDGGSAAYDINNAGQIVGEASLPNGESHAALWKLHVGDADGDGVADADDAFPMNNLEWLNTDGEAHGRGHVEDANKDGILDMVLHFSTKASQMLCGDTATSVTGSTTDGTAFTGADSIRVIPCR